MLELLAERSNLIQSNGLPLLTQNEFFNINHPLFFAIAKNSGLALSNKWVRFMEKMTNIQ